MRHEKSFPSVRIVVIVVGFPLRGFGDDFFGGGGGHFFVVAEFFGVNAGTTGQ